MVDNIILRSVKSIKSYFEYKHDIIILMNYHPSQIIIVDREDGVYFKLKEQPFKYELKHKILYLKARMSEELIIIHEDEIEVKKVAELI